MRGHVRKKKAKTAPAKKKSRAKQKAAPTKKKAAAGKKGKPAARKSKAKAARGSDVERRWRTYLTHRNSLEQAVETVRAAEASLSAAREEERKLRTDFDDAKKALEDFLEVEPAGRSRASQRRLDDVPTLPPVGDEGPLLA